MSISFLHQLENGDRLSREDFETLCRQQDITAAELIGGIVRMNAAALRFTHHGEPHSFVIGWLMAYKVMVPTVRVADNTSVRFDEANIPQPDALMFLPMDHGGRCRISEDGFLEGIPELIVEVAASSVSFDAHQKKALYENCGVPEYILWRTEDQQIDWFIHSGSRFEKQIPDDDGILKSRVFSGLRLHTTAMLSGDLCEVVRVLQKSHD